MVHSVLCFLYISVPTLSSLFVLRLTFVFVFGEALKDEDEVEVVLCVTQRQHGDSSHAWIFLLRCQRWTEGLCTQDTLPYWVSAFSYRTSIQIVLCKQSPHFGATLIHTRLFKITWEHIQFHCFVNIEFIVYNNTKTKAYTCLKEHSKSKKKMNHQNAIISHMYTHQQTAPCVWWSSPPLLLVCRSTWSCWCASARTAAVAAEA